MMFTKCGLKKINDALNEAGINAKVENNAEGATIFMELESETNPDNTQ